MANPEHVLKLLDEGVEAWNAWVEKQGDEFQADLSGSKLEHLRAAGAKLSGANLNDANLSLASFPDADLRGASLSRAQLLGANLSKANLSGAMMARADCSNANFFETDLSDANLAFANLTEAGLLLTDFSGADLKRTDFSKTSLLAATGYVLDSCRLVEAQLPFQPRDPWGKLKLRYTGLRAVAHLLALGIFLLPFLAKTLFWSATNAGQSQLLQATLQAEQLALALEDRSRDLDARIDAQADALPVDVPRPGSLTDRAARIRAILSNVQPCLSANCRELPVWKLVLGLDQGWTFGLLTGLLILYNIARGFLTFGVSRVRQAEAESRTHASPAKSDYWRLWQAHRYVVHPLFLGAMLAFAFNAYVWLILTKVSVPAG